MEARLRVAILTEAGPAIGLGHLARCAALYDALETLRCECELAVAGEAPAHVVGDRRVRLGEWRTPELVARALAGMDIAVVDSYHAGPGVYAVVADEADAAVYLDDTARIAYPHGFVVNAGPDAAALTWQPGTEAERLLGIEYLVLRREFSGPVDRIIRPNVERVLVVAGGTDAAGVRDFLVRVVSSTFPAVDVDVVDSPRTASGMRDAMLAADIAVSAAGQTLYELAATGTPTVAVIVADNQRSQARALGEAGVLTLGGRSDDPDTPGRIGDALIALAEKDVRQARSVAGQRLVDGYGALRVARRAVGAVIAGRLEIRQARQDDEARLLDLANDPAVRAASFSSGRINPGEHHAWLESRLADRDTLLLVAMEGPDLAGQVRFDIQGDSAVVSISLATDYRGLGISGPVLHRATTALEAAQPGVRVLVARVKPDNAASRRLFEEAGFSQTGPDAATPGGALELRRRLEAG